MKPRLIQHMRSQRGFTLLELIVAVSILAIIAVLSWRGLDAVLHTRDSLNDSQARSDEFQRGFNRLEHDTMLAKEVRLFPGGRFRLLAINDTAVEYWFEGDILMRRVLGAAQDNQSLTEPQEQQVLFSQLSGLRVDLYKKASDGKGNWSDTPTTQLLAPPVPNPGTNSGGNAGANAGQNAGQNTPANQPVAGPPSPVGPTNAALPGTTGFDFRLATGLRMTLNLKQGGMIQRIFLLGSTA